jgi:hypothetical protein
MNDLFADRLLNISVLGGVVRLDFARVDGVNPEDKKVQMSPSYRIAVPMDALVQIAEQSSQIVAAIRQHNAQSEKAQPAAPTDAPA